MVNGMGRDRGAALILEQAALPATTTDARRTRVIAVYTMLQDLGHAVGAAAAGLPRLLTGAPAHDASPDKVAILACAALAIAGAVLYGRLGRALDAAAPAPGAAPLRASPETRRILIKISALFGLDSLAGGFLTQAMLTYFFFDRFGVDELTVGLLFAAARVMNAGSHLAAAWLARRIGLVNTMVFTHIPSSVLLVTVAIAPSFEVAVVLFLLREGLVEMDVPTRQSYVLAVVAPPRAHAGVGRHPAGAPGGLGDRPVDRGRPHGGRLVDRPAHRRSRDEDRLRPPLVARVPVDQAARRTRDVKGK